MKAKTETVWYCKACDRGVSATERPPCPNCKAPMEDMGWYEYAVD